VVNTVTEMNADSWIKRGDTLGACGSAVAQIA
jgi:hypothetical protein